MWGLDDRGPDRRMQRAGMHGDRVEGMSALCDLASGARARSSPVDALEKAERGAGAEVEEDDGWWTIKHTLSLRVHDADLLRSLQDYHKRVSQYIKAPIPAMKKKLEEFLKICTYVSGQYDEDGGFEDLEKELKKCEESYSDKSSPKNRVFYMALPPSVFTVVAANFKKHNYSEGGINRIIVEKPFGKDLESSREMQVGLKKEWKEEEVRQLSPASLRCVQGLLLLARHALAQLSWRADDLASCRRRSSASTTTSARRWSRTCSSCASPTSCSTRRSTRTSSRTSRSRSRSRSAPRGAAATLTSSASSATLCRTVRPPPSSLALARAAAE